MEVVMPGDQDILDQRRVADEDHACWAKPQPHEVTVLARAPREEPERVVVQFGQVPQHTSPRLGRANPRGRVRICPPWTVCGAHLPGALSVPWKRSPVLREVLVCVGAALA